MGAILAGYFFSVATIEVDLADVPPEISTGRLYFVPGPGGTN